MIDSVRANFPVKIGQAVLNINDNGPIYIKQTLKQKFIYLQIKSSSFSFISNLQLKSRVEADKCLYVNSSTVSAPPLMLG